MMMIMGTLSKQVMEVEVEVVAVAALEGWVA